MEAEIVKIVTGTFSNVESIRTQAEDALSRLDKGKRIYTMFGFIKTI